MPGRNDAEMGPANSPEYSEYNERFESENSVSQTRRTDNGEIDHTIALTSAFPKTLSLQSKAVYIIVHWLLTNHHMRGSELQIVTAAPEASFHCCGVKL